MYSIEKLNDGFALYLEGKLILSHTSARPGLFLGKGRESIKMFRGNFDIFDRISQRIAPQVVSASQERVIFSHPDLYGEYTLSFEECEGLLRIRGGFYKDGCGDEGADGGSCGCGDGSVGSEDGCGNGGCGCGGFNRLFLRFEAEEKEHVTGGGEQFSAIDLRGKLYPIWTREQGVGRNKLTEVTRLADALDGSGGDYHTTFFPQPTFVSSRMYFAHLEDYCYSELDFIEKDFHELGLWSNSFSLVLGAGESYAELLEKLTGLLGRQPALPEWAMKGLWLGVQGGTERATALRDKCLSGGMDLSAVWIQDWEGKRVTSFGKRLQWDWRWNREMYPGLDRVIAEDKDCAWMGYINPYLVDGGVLFAEASEKGYFVKRKDGEDYLFDFGEYNCGVVDLTSPTAFEWYKNVIKTNLIGLGFKGWMADFGEYLPADAVCANGETGMTAHNEWPMLWAKCNREAVEESGLLGDCVFFMRAGAAGSQKYSTLVWAGDQCVDWSEDDGLPSVITAAITLGMSGYGLHTCDAGGYTTLFHLKRDRELMLRWLEFACFTPVMRTHEGNRPDSNLQLYSDDEIISAGARLTRLHTELLPYLSHCVEQNAEKGLPVMRGLFMEAPGCEEAYKRELYSYMLGDDMLVCPVVEQGAVERTVWLPEGDWVELWTGNTFSGGSYTVAAPIGKPPVFYKASSKYGELFEAMRNK